MTIFSFLFPSVNRALVRLRNVLNNHNPYYNIMARLTGEEAVAVAAGAVTEVDRLRAALTKAKEDLGTLPQDNETLRQVVADLEAEDARVDEALSALRDKLGEDAPPAEPTE
jgi:hypothetical protein